MYQNNIGLRQKKVLIPIAMALLALAAFFVMQNRQSSAGGDYLPYVQIFSEDAAPVDVVVAVHVQYGMNNVPEGWLMGKWHVSEGQHIDKEIKIPAGKWARVWVRPADSSHWYLMPSQYWHDDGTCGSEFGVSNRSDNPSYHTSFANAIHQWDVPLLTDTGCTYGSQSYR